MQVLACLFAYTCVPGLHSLKCGSLQMGMKKKEKNNRRKSKTGKNAQALLTITIQSNARVFASLQIGTNTEGQEDGDSKEQRNGTETREQPNMFWFKLVDFFLSKRSFSLGLSSLLSMRLRNGCPKFTVQLSAGEWQEKKRADNLKEVILSPTLHFNLNP